jgi:cytochrome c-type biogenesis protein
VVTLAPDLTGPLIVAAAVAVAAGLVSFLSPCVLPLVPGYLTVMSGVGAAQFDLDRERPARGRAVLAGVLFVAGFTIVFVSFGAVFGGLGHAFREHAVAVQRVIGAMTVLLGLAFMGAFDRIPWASREWRLHGVPRLGLVAAPLLGFMFGLGWTPCIGPTLSAVLGMAAASDSPTATRGALLAFFYCVGLGLPFILTALLYEHSLVAFGWVRGHTRTIMVAGGAGLVLLGLAEFFGMWNSAIQIVQTHTWTVNLPL